MQFYQNYLSSSKLAEYASGVSQYTNGVLHAKIETPSSVVSLNYINYIQNFKDPKIEYKHTLSGNLLGMKHTLAYGSPEYIQVDVIYTPLDIFGFILRIITPLLVILCIYYSIVKPFSSAFYIFAVLILLSKNSANAKSQYLFSKNCLFFVTASLSGKSVSWLES